LEDSDKPLESDVNTDVNGPRKTKNRRPARYRQTDSDPEDSNDIVVKKKKSTWKVNPISDSTDEEDSPATPPTLDNIAEQVKQLREQREKEKALKLRNRPQSQVASKIAGSSMVIKISNPRSKQGEELMDENMTISPPAPSPKKRTNASLSPSVSRILFNGESRANYYRQA